MTEKQLFILDAMLTKQDGTTRPLSEEEALACMRPGEQINFLKEGTITITWIEGTPEHLVQVFGILASK